MLFNRRKLVRVILAIAFVAAGIVLPVASFILTRQRNLSLQAVEIPLRYVSVQKDYFILVTVEDRIGWMLFDTGSSITLLDRSMFNHRLLGRQGAQSEKVFLYFHNKFVTAQKYRVRDITIGEWKLLSPTVGLVDRAYLGVPSKIDGHPVFGILGYDVIRKWDFVKISRKKVILSNRLLMPSRTKSVAFPLATNSIDTGVLSIIVSYAPPQPKGIWYVDTGVDCHFVKVKARHRSLGKGNHEGNLFSHVNPLNREGQALWLPARAVHEKDPPFARQPQRLDGIIGNGILQRYDVVIDHRNMYIYFIENYQTDRYGTFGLLLFHQPPRGGIFARFIVPPEPISKEDFVELVAIGGRRITHIDKDIAERILKHPIGSSALFTVRTRSGQIREITYPAFAPEEIGIISYIGNIKLSNRKEALFTVLVLNNNKTWIWPFRFVVPEKGKLDIEMSLRIASDKSKSSLTITESSEAGLSCLYEPPQFTIHLQPLH